MKNAILTFLILFHVQALAQKSGLRAVEEAIRLTTQILKPTGLADISLMLRRIAKVESNFGQNSRTYREGYHGGIWQIDKIAFAETKRCEAHPRLKGIHAAINKALPSCQWKDVSWEECRNPLYSCLAARIYLALVPSPVPIGLEEQALYWKKFYNTNAGSGSPEGFIAANSPK